MTPAAVPAIRGTRQRSADLEEIGQHAAEILQVDPGRALLRKRTGTVADVPVGGTRETLLSSLGDGDLLHLSHLAAELKGR
jgi:hypothetical protein